MATTVDRVTAIETAMDGFHTGWREPPEAPPDQIVSGPMLDGFTIPASEEWEIVGGVESAANVVVLGKLRMRPGSSLRFVDMDESLFVGAKGPLGDLTVLDTDVGLWVMGDGQLDIQGTPKVAWNRTGFDPSWGPDDELILCPTAVGDYDGFTPYTMGDPVPTVGPYSAEVLNLSRDISIEGTPGDPENGVRPGRSHIFINSTQPQTIKHVALRHLGPRFPILDEGTTVDGDVIPGRWGIHYHKCGDGSRESINEGIVGREFGSHAFFQHISHGGAWRDCIAYDCLQSPYTWNKGDPSNTVLWDRCVAAKIDRSPTFNFEKHSGAGFVLRKTPDNDSIIRDCVAVGVMLRGGFDWADAAKQTQWATEGSNVAHNNRGVGLRSWHNSGQVQHSASGFVVYRNRGPAIEHGAYATTFWHYANLHLLENEAGGILNHAVVSSLKNPPDRADGYRQSFESLIIEGQDMPWLHSPRHIATAVFPVLYKDIEIVNGSMEVLIDERGNFGLYDLVNVVSSGASLEPSDITIAQTLPGFLLRCQRPDGTAWQIDDTGAVSDIAPFYVEVV